MENATIQGSMSWAGPYALDIAPSRAGFWAPSNACIFAPAPAHTLNGISIGSAVGFCSVVDVVAAYDVIAVLL